MPVSGRDEGAGGGVRDRRFDDVGDGAIGGDANDACATVTAVPEVSFGVHRGAVGESTLEAGEDDLAALETARDRIEATSVEAVRQRVAEVHRLAVGRPRERIADTET